MEILLALCALVVAALTLYSGFGLGTLLLPVLALFYPPHVAVAATAVVHFLNNLLKLALLWTHVDGRVLWRFAAPAIPFAFLGAWLLGHLADLSPLTTYELGGRTFEITGLGLAIGVLVLLFAVLELSGALRKVAFPPRLLPLGGALSGFFGGLSGHQGALRSVVLLKAGLSKEAYVATGTAASTLVDAARLLVYGTAWIGSWNVFAEEHSLVPLLIAVVCALAGTVLGVRLLGKVTLDALHTLVGILLLLAGLAIALGLSA